MKFLQQELENFKRVGGALGIDSSQLQSDCGGGGKYIEADGRTVIDLTRLDYLALGSEDRIRQLMRSSIDNHDVSCPASQLIMKPGSLVELEQSLARWHGLNDSLLFSNGYSVNINIMQALGMRLRSPHLSAYAKSLRLGQDTRHIPTVFLIDNDSHYSLIHGARIACKLSPHCHSYGHQTGQIGQLKANLEKVQERFGDEVIKVIVSDTLVSSTGNYIDIASLYAVAEDHDCLLYLDEAHAVGAVGPRGAGVAAEHLPEDFNPERLIIMGTLTKAFSQLGGYASFGNTDLMAMVRAASPQYIFSAPLLPWMADTLTQSLELITGEWGESKRQVLISNSRYLREQLALHKLDTLGSQSHIIPVLIGDEVKCLAARHALLGDGFNVACFPYPAVPKGRAILRISMSSDISIEEIDLLVAALVKHCVAQPELICE